MSDETELLVRLGECLDNNAVTTYGMNKSRCCEIFRQYGRANIPEEPPKSWVQFQDTIFDYITQTTFPADPTYFITNPLPWKIGTMEQTPKMDALLKQWVNDDMKVSCLYELLAFCTLRDYPLHRIFTLIGTGNNGKSKFLDLIQRFIGMNNVCSTELDQLGEGRFERAQLHRKLVCLVGETNFAGLEGTGMIKRLSGGDIVSFEFKNKMPFVDVNYAKIIISTNSLPTCDDTSMGWFRRWNIIDFSNEFPESKNPVEDIPLVEFENLAKKCTILIPELIKRGYFCNESPKISDRKNVYQAASNPLPLFIEKNCTQYVGAYMRYSEMYKEYTQFLMGMKRRVVGRKEFGTALTAAGFDYDKTSKKIDDVWQHGWFVFGLDLKSNKTSPINTVINRWSALPTTHTARCSYCGIDNKIIIWKDIEGNYACHDCYYVEIGKG